MIEPDPLTPTTHGGKRPNAGRKPTNGEPVVKSSVSLPPQGFEMWDRVRGTLSRSAWLMLTLEKSYLRHQVTQQLSKLSDK